ncbi:hypothetical protein ACLOJK_006356 [Asimina triloba]
MVMERAVLTRRAKRTPLDGVGMLESPIKGLHLIHLLLVYATVINENKTVATSDNLAELYRSVSLIGNSIQLVAAYFTNSLVARLLTKRSPFYPMIMKKPTPEEELSAFTELYRASLDYQFAHFTANQDIIDAFEEEEEHNGRCLHVIDFYVSKEDRSWWV